MNTKIKSICLSALLASLSIIIAYICKMYLTFASGSLRLTFENLPIFFCGLILGPVYSTLVAIVSDILSCIIAANAINPIILAGSAVIGLLAGLLPKLFKKLSNNPKIILTVFISHLLGSVIIKSLGLYVYYSIPIQTLAIRIPIYIFISAVEAALLIVLQKNKSIQRMINKG